MVLQAYFTLLCTREVDPHGLYPQALSSATFWLFSADRYATNRRSGGGIIRVTSGHSFTQLPPGWTVVVAFFQRAWLLSDCTVSAFLHLSLSLPFSSLGAVMVIHYYHHSLLVSPNFCPHTSKLSFHLNSLVTSFEYAICFLPGSLDLT